LRRLAAERENIIAALRWLVESGDAPRALRLTVSLSWFWLLSGSQNDADAALELALAVPGEADPLDRVVAETLVTFTRAASSRDPDFDMRTTAGEVLARLRGLDLTPRPFMVVVLPLLAWAAGDVALADELFGEARAHADPWVRAAVPLAMAKWAENGGDTVGMRRHFDTALVAFREVGDRWGLSVTLAGIGGLRMLENDLAGSAAALEEARALFQELGAEGEHAMLLLQLADVRLRQGDLDDALALARRAWAATDLAGSESALIGGALARLLWLLGEREEARETLHHAAATVERLGERGHVHAMVGAIAALFALDDGDPELARASLGSAYPSAVGTEDMPVVALVAVAVAALALDRGAPGVAATILGAAARLRGSDDATNPDIARITARLREDLGDAELRSAFAAGRAMDREAAVARVDPARL
jgi:tetratricopeptide (TPR) repeat protein